jgi:hypothetical protein
VPPLANGFLVLMARVPPLLGVVMPVVPTVNGLPDCATKVALADQPPMTALSESVVVDELASDAEGQIVVGVERETLPGVEAVFE